MFQVAVAKRIVQLDSSVNTVSTLGRAVPLAETPVAAIRTLRHEVFAEVAHVERLRHPSLACLSKAPLLLYCAPRPKFLLGLLGDLITLVSSFPIQSDPARWNACVGSRRSGALHALPSGPDFSNVPLLETHRGSLTRVRAVSPLATPRNRAATSSSSNTTRRTGCAPWSSTGCLVE